MGQKPGGEGASEYEPSLPDEIEMLLANVSRREALLEKPRAGNDTPTLRVQESAHCLLHHR